jgi:signal transduction histidine kinase/ActR/RegA family two-component response regulator
MTSSLAAREPALCGRPPQPSMTEEMRDRAEVYDRIARFSQDDFATGVPTLSLPEASLQLEALREADRHKDEFLAVLGHELRNPLGAILNGIEALEKGALPAADAAEMRAVIHRQATNMSRLVDGLLDVTRIASGKIVLKTERLDLVQLLRDVADDRRREIETQGAALRLKLMPGAIWCAGDRLRLWQVMGNLLGNAAKFLGGPGEVTVEVRNDVPGRRATIEIRDTGIGIEPQALHRIFQPFVQAERSRDQSRGGLGIGLALVRGLVELHGGHVTAASAGPGRGSQFSVSLPTCARQAADPHILEPQRGPVIRRRVLLIDDRRDAILPVKTILELCGHEVSIASDGLSGLVLARRIVPQVILCDIGLPGELDGCGVAIAIRSDAALRDVYLAAVSGYAREEDRQRCRDVGFNWHLSKPVSAGELESLMKNLPRFAKSAKTPLINIRHAHDEFIHGFHALERNARDSVRGSPRSARS